MSNERRTHGVVVRFALDGDTPRITVVDARGGEPRSFASWSELTAYLERLARSRARRSLR